MADSEQTMVCRHCGEEIDASAQACPHCGSDENTGWSEKTYLDGVELPDDEEYEEIYRKEFGEPAARSLRGNWMLIAGAAVLVAFVALVIWGLC